ncbi:MAG: AgmX/PglI C-terminal domain-containing protein [Anaeromyxobacteraceae bacterium]
MSLPDRFPARLAALATAGALSACATGSGADGSANVAGRNRRVEVLDLMARKADAAPMDTGPVPGGGRARGRSLDHAVSRTVEGHRRAFQSCLERTSKGPPVRTRATLLLKVRASGAVSDARVVERHVRARPLGQCLVDASYRMTFPAFDGPPLEVRVPLDLQAR